VLRSVNPPGMLVRPIAPTDEAAYLAILETTSAEDRYCRFFHAVDHFDPNEVRHFVEERSDMIGMIAFEGAAPLGAAHAALLDEHTAELAIVVARGERHHGVGAAMLDALIVELKRRRYQRVIACALRENTPFGTLAKHAGFTVEKADGGTVRWVLSLISHEPAPSP
jgi:RimJ/RimL family protein N-acetyltransferase